MLFVLFVINVLFVNAKIHNTIGNMQNNNVKIS